MCPFFCGWTYPGNGEAKPRLQHLPQLPSYIRPLAARTIPGAGFHPIGSIEEGGSATVAGIGGIYALNVSVAWVLEELHEHCFDSLGLIDDGLSAHLQAAHRVPGELRALHQLLHHRQAEGVDVLLDRAEAHLGLAQAHGVPPCFHLVKLLQLCLVHVLGWKVDLHGKNTHILGPSICFGQGDSWNCRKTITEKPIKIPWVLPS